MTGLQDLEMFAAVAKHRSFRGAASAHGVSASALSEAVRRLEERLGVRLLNRTTRSVTASEAGAQLLARLEPALSEIGAALDVVNGFRDTPKGALRLNVPVIVAHVILPPIVRDFLALYPGVTLEVIAEDTFIDIAAAGFDAGVRYDERLEQDMIALPIGPRVQRFATAAAPAYWQSRGKPQHPRELLEHACIRHRFSDRPPFPWEFRRGKEVMRIDPSGPLVATTLELELQAATAGIGVISSFEDYLRPFLASGVLEPALEEWWDSFPGPFLYYSSRRHMPKPLRAFVDFIKARPEA
jgi:DNA-binding transcriptional LysR family regulator